MPSFISASMVTAAKLVLRRAGLAALKASGAVIVAVPVADVHLSTVKAASIVGLTAAAGVIEGYLENRKASKAEISAA